MRNDTTAYRKTGVGSIIGVGREVVARRANGELIQVYLSVGEFSARGESYYEGVLHDITDHKRMDMELVRLAQTDELTGAFNRRHFMGKLEAEIHRFNRYRRPLSLMIVDLDHFKRVNDSYGHAVGDLALRAVVELLRGELREQDELARQGGIHPDRGDRRAAEPEHRRRRVEVGNDQRGPAEGSGCGAL
jgi:hypothetical protein